MRSVDTVKTRLQGQPSANPPKYHNMFHAYGTILREEGVTRGLYSGVAPAMTGSCKSIALLTLLTPTLVLDLIPAFPPFHFFYHILTDPISIAEQT